MKPKSQKKKMATSREVYDRIRWDARLDPSVFVIGYRERTPFERMGEKAFLAWQVNGDIPWHRIRYIRCQEVIVWERDRHLDLISLGQLPAAAWVTPAEVKATSISIAPAFEPLPVYGYSSGDWYSSEGSFDSATVGKLKIASFNVLCDRYESENIETAKRLPAIAEHLRLCDADIIALQEATPPLLELLLAQDWMRYYYISELLPASSLQPYGLLLLSRLPFTLVQHQYSAHKRVLVGTWLLNGELLRVAVVHLPSDRARNGIELRQEQLNRLLAYLKTQSGACLIIGDFNSKGEELELTLTQNNFVDLWQLLHSGEAGYTFDPQRNSLAALISLSGNAARFDRILLKDEAGYWLPHLMKLFAEEPIPDTGGKLYASDHFGVRAELESTILTTASLQKVRSVYQSAVVIIPPPEIWPAIQTIRHRFDAKFHRWMPHINLLYGFIPEEYFDEVVEAIAPKLAALQPFTITLTGFETFTHRSSCTAWLQPLADPSAALHQLQAILQQLFPQCNEQSIKSSAGFIPHLSVGQFDTASEAATRLPHWHPVSFQVESVALISRRGDEPFEVRSRVYLQGKQVARPHLIQLVNQLDPELSLAQKTHRETILTVVKQACAEILGFAPSLHLLGSARLKVETAQSDLDLLCLIPPHISGEVFLANVQQKLASLCDRSRLVKDAKVPALRMQMEGVAVDLLYARTLSTSGKFERQNFDSVSWMAVLGCLEADAIADIVSQYVSFDSFRKLIIAVRAWAKIRQIHGNDRGFLGSFSWTLLAAWSCHYSRNIRETEMLLANFFQVLARHDWNQPIALTEASKNYQMRLSRDWFPIITLIEPCQNSARNVSRSTAQILQNEFTRSAEITVLALAGKIGWETLFESPDLGCDRTQYD